MEHDGLLSVLRTRRSIRKYGQEPIPHRELEKLKEAVLRSPSSRGFAPWTFVWVRDKELLEALSRAKPHGASFLKQADLGVVVCGDETVSDVWVEDCSIAAIIVHLQAHALGLGSCWVQIRKRPHDPDDPGQTAEGWVQRLLGIPAHLRVLCIVAVGLPAERKEGHPPDRLDWQKIKADRYG